MRVGRSWHIAGICVFLSWIAGCGREDSPEGTLQQAIVSGIVNLDGKTLTSGTVTLIPVEGDSAGREPGIARIESDGSYWLGNANLSDPAGVPPGRYKVTVLSMAARPDGPVGPVARLVTPERYGSVTTTPLEVEVVAGENRIHLDLFEGSEERTQTKEIATDSSGVPR